MAAGALVQREILGRGRSARSRWLAPAMLLAVALLAAAALAYGTRASLGQYDGGVAVIVLVRRVQWLLVGASLVGSMSLLTLVIGNRCSPWWLAGLAPVLALFAMRFGSPPGQYLLELDASQFADPWHPAVPRDEEWVVGLLFEGDAYAFPYRALHVRPLITVTDYSKRMLLMWSPHANRAVAVHLTRDLRPRALEVVSTPADSLLILDRRYGQFISSITGRLINGGEAVGFSRSIPVTRARWSSWRAAHPQTRVLLLAGLSAAGPPSEPLRPRALFPPRVTADAPAELPIVLLGTRPPVAVPVAAISDQPLNLAGGSVRALLLRDPASGRLRAFERRASQDLFPVFSLRPPARDQPEPLLIDSDSQSLWTFDGLAVNGPLKGERLEPITVEHDLYWGAMKFWYADLQLLR